jgi:hypothetical protein
MYDLRLQAPGEIKLSLDGQLLAQSSNVVESVQYLYKGEHGLEVSVHVEGPGAVRLLANGTPLPESAYFVHPEAGNGLLGSFYANDNFSGNPTFRELDPFIGFAYHSEAAVPRSLFGDLTRQVAGAGDRTILIQSRGHRQHGGARR